MPNKLTVNNHVIGPGQKVYIVAEMSGNHNHNFEQARQILYAAKEAGADAVKLQTYTPDTLTIDCDNEFFQVGKGTSWEGKKLYDLYEEAYTPWEWQKELKRIADELNIDLFSTPFDETAVDFLEELNMPVHKVASFENIDLPLLRKIGQTGKPVIMSTGMASEDELDEAVQTLKDSGCTELALLKCTSAYPAPASEMNIRTIPYLAERYKVPVGLSDHSLEPSVAIASVALGASIVEKHFTLSRKQEGPDSKFSLEPHELSELVHAIRTTEKALGKAKLKVTKRESASKVFRRSLFIVQDVKAGEKFTEKNLRSIRPGYGLPPKHIGEIIGKTATCDISRGTPLSWDLVKEME